MKSINFIIPLYCCDSKSNFCAGFFFALKWNKLQWAEYLVESMTCNICLWCQYASLVSICMCGKCNGSAFINECNKTNSQSQSRISESKSKVDFVDFIRSLVWKCFWLFLQILPRDHFVLFSEWVAFKSTKKCGIMNLMLQWFCYRWRCVLYPWCTKSSKTQNSLLPGSCRIDWGTRRWF